MLLGSRLGQAQGLLEGAQGHRRPASAALARGGGPLPACRRPRDGCARTQGQVRAFKGDEALQGAAAPAAAVTFKACKRVAFGQALKVVGSLPQLGAWDLYKAPAMEWGEGDQWLLSLDLPPGRHEFKVVVAPAQGSAGPAFQDWEAGPNRTLQVPAPEAAAHGAFTVVCEWGRTQASLETLPDGQLAAAESLSGSESDEPHLRADDLRAEPYSPNGDEGESPVGMMPAPTRLVAKRKMGAGADEELHGIPAGGLKPSTEVAVKEELKKKAAAAAAAPGPPSQPGLFSRFLQALTGRRADDDDDTKGGGSSSGTAGRSGGSSTAQQPRHGEEPPAASSSMQLGIAALGLAALPMVAWSEWTLKSTGCGLPPGPSGVLGAAEGISYLVVGGVVLWSLSRKLSTGRGLPAGPAGALGAVEGGSWLAALSGLVVLALQWQTYGYIPSALPDSNCFGAEAGSTARSLPATATNAAASRQLPATPSASGVDTTKAGLPFGGVMRLRALGAASLPQGNLVFSAETLLSQSGTIVEGAETAAAAMAAVAHGQPPPAQVSAAVQQLKARVAQARQLVQALGTRLLYGEAALQASVQAAAAVEAAPAPVEPAAEVVSFEPPRHKVRAALGSSMQHMAESKALRVVMEPMPLPASARTAAAAAAAATDALAAADAAAKQAVERSLASTQQEQRVVGAVGQRAVVSANIKAQRSVQQPQQGGAAAAALAAAPAPGTDAQPASPDAAAAAGSSGSSSTIAASLDVMSSVFSDLREGYVGLWEEAKVFEPRTALACLQERFVTAQAVAQAAQEQRAAAEAAATTKQPAATAKLPAAAAATTKQPAATAKQPAAAAATAKQPATTVSPIKQPAAAAATAKPPTAPAAPTKPPAATQQAAKPPVGPAAPAKPPTATQKGQSPAATADS